MVRNGKFEWLIFTLILVLVIGCGCGKSSTIPQGVKVTPAYAEGRELYLQVDTREEAERIAELYEISLVDFNYEVAVFHTNEPPEDVIARGKQNNWPQLSINSLKEYSDESQK